MDVLHPQKPPQSTRLNPSAPIFVPMKSYQTVEDFSDQWWDLVHSSPFFRDYWLQDCFDDVDENEDFFYQSQDLDLLDFDLYLPKEGEEMVVMEEKKENKEVISMAALKWSESGGKTVEVPRYFEKAPKFVKSVKVNPRTIHQPR